MYDLAKEMNEQILLGVADNPKIQANALSTLGWIMFLEGNKNQGEIYIERAIEITPKSHNDRREYYIYMLNNLKKQYG